MPASSPFALVEIPFRCEATRPANDSGGGGAGIAGGRSSPLVRSSVVVSTVKVSSIFAQRRRRRSAAMGAHLHRRRHSRLETLKNPHIREGRNGPPRLLGRRPFGVERDRWPSLQPVDYRRKKGGRDAGCSGLRHHPSPLVEIPFRCEASSLRMALAEEEGPEPPVGAHLHWLRSQRYYPYLENPVDIRLKEGKAISIGGRSSPPCRHCTGPSIPSSVRRQHELLRKALHGSSVIIPPYIAAKPLRPPSRTAAQSALKKYGKRRGVTQVAQACAITLRLW